MTVVEAAPGLIGRAVSPATAEVDRGRPPPHRGTNRDRRAAPISRRRRRPHRVRSDRGRTGGRHPPRRRPGRRRHRRAARRRTRASGRPRLRQRDRGRRVLARLRRLHDRRRRLREPARPVACARDPAPSPRLRLESVDNAVEQARSRGSHRARRPPRPYRGSRGSGRTRCGRSCRSRDWPRADATSSPGPAHDLGSTPSCGSGAARLVAAECVNAPADFLTVRKALAAGGVIDRETVARPAKLKDLLTRPGV